MNLCYHERILNLKNIAKGFINKKRLLIFYQIKNNCFKSTVINKSIKITQFKFYKHRRFNRFLIIPKSIQAI